MRKRKQTELLQLHMLYIYIQYDGYDHTVR